MVDKLRPKSIRSPGSPCAWAPGDGKLSELIEYTDVIGGTGTVVVGTIPAGATFLGCKSWCVTAFNGGSADALIVGIPTDTNYFIEDGHPTNANSETTETNVLDYTPSADVVVSAIYTHSGAAPTTGKVRVTVYYKRAL